jgi:predicted transcriptional regulator
MNINIPPIKDVQAELQPLGHAEMQELARLSTVPFTTLWKIRAGDTLNPGIETVRRFYGHIGAVKKKPDPELGALAGINLVSPQAKTK